ncbi:hypothetical protein Dimus_018614, partial [Dionaea muscipula]
KPLPLLIWNGEPIDDDDDSQDIHENGVVGDPLVGWPPIKNFRKLTYGRRNYNVARPNDPIAADVNRGVGDGADGDGRWRSSCLKVQMEGVLITRKINLSFLHHHQSYNALSHSLISLFGKAVVMMELVAGDFCCARAEWSPVPLLMAPGSGQWIVVVSV